jgi:hypothetical protein
MPREEPSDERPRGLEDEHREFAELVGAFQSGCA